DYGIPTHLPWGVKFPVGLPPTTAENMRTVWGINVPASIPGDQLIAVHPTQVYETLICLGIWLVGRKLIRRHLQPGTAGLWIFALLAVERFGVEFLRAKDDRFFGSFTLAQVISVAVLILIFWIWAARSHIRRGRHDRGSPSEG
ncbi:MAG TPA: prolipoprotein diacylglyceryl transferase family protein, partial [Thermoanaerobaculia bacterium]|nr:prolipoprotein diacylglyceryl transferase family protein [Thermoanaerobaculia bacterium]